MFIVGIDGVVSQAKVKKSTHEVFNEAARAAVRSWTFAAAVEEGNPVASGMAVPGSVAPAASTRN